MDKCRHNKNLKQINALIKKIETSSFEEHYKILEKIEKIDELYINEFENYLKKNGLSKKTISQHAGNAYFFWNDYYVEHFYDSPFNAFKELDDFLGYFFPRKCMWATVNSLNRYVSSLKKFTIFLFENDYMSSKDFSNVIEQLKYHKEYWIDSLLEITEMTDDEDVLASFEGLSKYDS